MGNSAAGPLNEAADVNRTFGGDPDQCAGDGRSGASNLTIQHPNLLRGYVVRSPCKVAGVDYAVGPQQLATKDPATISMAGVSVDASTRTVSITGNNVTLDGYDFSLHGGYQVYVSGANTTIRNSNFALGTNTGAYLISGGPSALNLMVEYCTMDASTIGSQTSLIGYAGSGAITLEYNWFKNFPQHVLELSQGLGVSFYVVYKYNLIDQGAIQAGAHLNYLQFGGGTVRQPMSRSTRAIRRRNPLAVRAINFTIIQKAARSTPQHLLIIP